MERINALVIDTRYLNRNVNTAIQRPSGLVEAWDAKTGSSVGVGTPRHGNWEFCPWDMQAGPTDSPQLPTGFEKISLALGCSTPSLGAS